MNDQDDSTYQKFSLDGDAPHDEQGESPSANDFKDLRIEKLGRRLTVISILIPCLIVMAVVTAYLDLKKRGAALQQTNAVVVREAIGKIAEQFNALSVKYDQLGLSIDEKIPSISKTAASLQENLKQTEKSLQTISGLKADKKALQDAVNQMEKTFADLRKDLDRLHSETKAASDEFNQSRLQLDKTITGLKKDISTAKSETSASLSQKMNKGELEKALQTNKEEFRQELNQVFKRLIAKEKRLAALDERIKTMERNLKTDFRNTPLNQLAPPEGGAIVEQSMPE